MGRKRKRPTIKSIATAIIAVALTLGVGSAFWWYTLDEASIEPDPELYPIRGIDISAHNGYVDFEKVKADGYEFVLIKATEGTDFKDRSFDDNIRRARNAQLKVGAYHFFRFDTDGKLQAINMLHSLRNRELDFPAVIDVEEWGNPDGARTSHIVGQLRAMIEHLEHFGYEVILYTNKDSYTRFIKGNFDEYPLWICSFTEIEPDIDWQLWQYSHSGRVDGIDGKVDLNTIKSDFIR